MGIHNRREFLGWLAACGVGMGVLSGDSANTADGDAAVLVGATVIDGTGAPARTGGVLILYGEWIVWTDSLDEPPPLRGIRVIDLRGKYVIPGLWDMHTHDGSNDRIVVPLHVANGVTSVREMWGFPAIHAARARIEAGELLGPRMTIASTIIDGRPSLWAPQAAQVVTASEARAAVRAAVDAESDFLKIYTYLGAEAFEALAQEARVVGLAVAGHHPARLRVADVSDAGMRSFEHLFGMPTATSTLEGEILRQLNEFVVDPANPRAFYDRMYALERLATRNHSPSLAAALYERMARNGSWQSPTLTVNRVLASPADTYANDPRLKYIDSSTKTVWANIMRNIAPRTPEEIAEQRAYFEFRLGMVGQMERAGVPILGGTDTPNPYVFPGFALHDELALLVTAGLSPMRALQTVTRDAARFLGLDDTMGTVEAGKIADLVVLDANPLDDIRNTQRIHSVVVRGRYIDSAERAQILADVERAAANPASPAPRLAGPFCACMA